MRGVYIVGTGVLDCPQKQQNVRLKMNERLVEIKIFIVYLLLLMRFRILIDLYDDTKAEIAIAIYKYKRLYPVASLMA